MYTLNKICQFTQCATFKYIHVIYLKVVFIYCVNVVSVGYHALFVFFTYFSDKLFEVVIVERCPIIH